MLAVIATLVIVNGGDSGSTSATVVVPPSRTTTPHLVPALPPETMTTITPTSRPPSPTTTPSATPPPVVPSAAPDVAGRTFVYRVAGTKGLLDLVTIVYTDASGAPQTDFNVSLPWSRTIVLNPGVSTRSVVATSLTGRLNCSIADAVGQNVALSTSSTMIATCTA